LICYEFISQKLDLTNCLAEWKTLIFDENGKKYYKKLHILVSLGTCEEEIVQLNKIYIL